jgi:hypothetical protein
MTPRQTGGSAIDSQPHHEYRPIRALTTTRCSGIDSVAPGSPRTRCSVPLWHHTTICVSVSIITQATGGPSARFAQDSRGISGRFPNACSHRTYRLSSPTPDAVSRSRSRRRNRSGDTTRGGTMVPFMASAPLVRRPLNRVSRTSHRVHCMRTRWPNRQVADQRRPVKILFFAAERGLTVSASRETPADGA